MEPNRESRLRFSAMPSFRVPSAEAGCRLRGEGQRRSASERIALEGAHGNRPCQQHRYYGYTKQAQQARAQVLLPPQKRMCCTHE